MRLKQISEENTQSGSLENSTLERVTFSRQKMPKQPQDLVGEEKKEDFL